MSSLLALKKACCEANRRLPELGLVDLTFGNVSVIDRSAGCFAIKPSGVGYADLKPLDIVVLDLEGKVVEGKLRPSSDTPTHRCLFRAFPHVGSIVHTHSRHATAFAQAGRALPCLGTTHADYFRGEIPVTRALKKTEIARDYEWETGQVIVERFATAKLDPDAIPAVLVRHHAPFAWGPDAAKSVENALALELVAAMALMALQIDPRAVPVPPALLDKHFLRKHGAASYYGQK